MRSLGPLFILLAACGGDGAASETYAFGPFELAPHEEVTEDCVQISLNNDDYVNVSVVELATGAGFHHSNWFYVPEHAFPGEDGTYRCDDRGFDQAVAAILGGVFFAQSTQSPHEVQAFPAGHVVRIPPKHKLVSQIHLLNPTDAPLALAPTIKVTSVPDDDSLVRLAGMSFTNDALALPPNMQSRWTVECDILPKHQKELGRAPDFKIHYALAHYHDLGTKLTIEAVKPTGEAAEIYSTATNIGDVMGGPIAPAFDFTGYTRVRLTCEYYNSRPSTVRYGNGNGEMCTFLAFTDSQYKIGGGETEKNGRPESVMMVGNTMTVTNTCTLVAISDNDRG